MNIKFSQKIILLVIGTVLTVSLSTFAVTDYFLDDYFSAQAQSEING